MMGTIKRFSTAAWFFVLLGASCLLGIGPGGLNAAVVNFDDLSESTDLTGSTYAGLTWEVGGPGLNGNIGFWGVDGDFPNSPPHNVLNGWGSTEIGIGFPSPVSVSGAYISSQAVTEGRATSLIVEGYRTGQLVATTPVFSNIDPSPDWFGMNLIDVDRIVFRTTPVYFGAGWFAMDDLTYTVVPEPSALAVFGLACVALLRWRR